MYKGTVNCSGIRYFILKVLLGIIRWKRIKYSIIVPMRLFAAIPIATQVSKTLFECYRGHDDPFQKPTPKEQLHITLHFIGDRPAHELTEMLEKFSRIAAHHESFDLVPDKIENVYRNDELRHCWLRFHPEPRFEQLNKALAKAVGDDIAQEIVPHITLFRYKKGSRKMFLPTMPELLPMKAERFVLFESILFKWGPEYKAVQYFDLKPAAPVEEPKE